VCVHVGDRRRKASVLNGGELSSGLLLTAELVVSFEIVFELGQLQLKVLEVRERKLRLVRNGFGDGLRSGAIRAQGSDYHCCIGG